jgi:uncharacterized protein DUF481
VKRVGAVLALVLAWFARVSVYAQGRTDVVTLANGDRITGEVITLERGRLEFKTDDAGTLYLEWDKLASVVAARFVEVVTSDGRRFLGSLERSADRSITVAGTPDSVTLAMTEVALIRAIGPSFWEKLDGSVDIGYSFTRSSGVSQLNLNSDTVYAKPASRMRLTASATLTQKEDDPGRDDRASVEASYLRYPWQNWFVIGAGRFESNESLGIKLRSQIAGAVGPRLVNTTRGQLAVGGGLVFNNEQGVDVEPTKNVEGLIVFSTSYYTYDRPKTNLDVNLQYYPSLSNIGRHRLQLDSSVKRELLKDFFVSLNLFDTFDSRPPDPTADRNDFGVVVSIGWTY